MISDINILVTSQVENEATKNGQLKLHLNRAQPSFSFYPEVIVRNNLKRFSQIQGFYHQIHEFSYLETNQEQPLSVKIGDEFWIRFDFKNEHDLMVFTGFIQRIFCLCNSEANRNLFLFEEYDSNYFGSYTLTVLSNDNCRRLSFNLVNKEFENFGFIMDEDVSCNDYLNVFDNDGRVILEKLFNKEIEPSLISELLNVLIIKDYREKTKSERNLYVLEQRVHYSKIKKQWKTITKKQFQNWTELKEHILRLEKYVDELSNFFKRYTDKNIIQEIAFNIFLTYSFWCWDSSNYIHNYTKFLVIFIKAFIKDTKDEYTINYDDEKILFEDMEADIFWCFTNFIEILNNDNTSIIRQPMLKNIFQNVGKVIFEKFPNFNSYLNQKHIFSLDFMFNDCINWFFDCFKDNEIIKLLISAFTFPDLFKFFQCFLLSYLVSLAPNFRYSSPIDFDEFLSEYQNIKHNMNLNTILSNTKKCIDLFNCY